MPKHLKILHKKKCFAKSWSKYGKYGPRSRYGFLRTGCRPIRMQEPLKPYSIFHIFYLYIRYIFFRFLIECIFYQEALPFYSETKNRFDKWLLETFLFLENFQCKLISLISIKFAWHCISSTVNHLNNPLLQGCL